MAFYSVSIKKCIQRGELVLYTHFECGLISRVGPHVFVCCGSSLTGDLPSAVWPAGLVNMCLCVAASP